MPVLENEMKRLSTETGKPVEDVKKEIEALMKQGFDDVSALAVWKSENSMTLGGKFLKQTVIRVIGTENIRQQALKDGTQVDVSGFGAFVKDGDNVVFCSFGLWREHAAIVKSLVPGAAYVCDVKVKDEDDTGVRRASLVGQINQATTAQEGDLPKAVDLLKRYGNVSVAKVADYVGNNGFFSGICGKMFAGTFGEGMELSDVGSNPISVYAGENGLGNVKVGSRVIVYGYVSAGKKGISIRASGVYVI